MVWQQFLSEVAFQTILEEVGCLRRARGSYRHRWEGVARFRCIKALSLSNSGHRSLFEEKGMG